MRVLAASVLAVGLVASWARGDDRLDQLIESWAEAKRDTKALIVEFSLETRDTLTGKREKSDGTFRLMRTPNGEVLASYQVAKPSGTRGRWSGLLNGGTVYLLNHDKKAAVRFERQSDDDLRRFLEEYFNPFVRLLDRKRVEESCRLEVVKQDESYTYVLVTPKQVMRSGWLPDRFHEGRAVFMRKASATVPKDMPRQLWYTNGSQDFAFDIRAWQINPAADPKVDDFAKPEDRPGWTVSDWPWRIER